MQTRKLLAIFGLLCALGLSVDAATISVWVSPGITGGLCNNQTQPFGSLTQALNNCHTVITDDMIINVNPGNYPASGNNQLPLSGVITIQATGNAPTFDLSSQNTFFASVGTNTRLILTSINFIGGTSISEGGLIYVHNDGTLTANGCSFTDAMAANAGGAIAIADSIGSSFTNCIFTNCKTTGTDTSTGGAVALLNSTATFTNVNFTSNSAHRGGAVYIAAGPMPTNADSVITFSSCTFTNNFVDSSNAGRTSSLGGGAVNVFAVEQAQDLQFINCSFSGNTASSSQGGAAYLGASTTASFTNSAFHSNAAFMGAGIYADNQAILSVSNSLFQFNVASHVVGETSGQGGALYMKAGFLTVTGTNFANNSAAENGGAVYLVGGSTHSQSDAQDSTNFTDCVFSFNTGQTGGALYAATLKMYLNIQSTNFLFNVANGTGLSAGGGAIYTNDARLGVNFVGTPSLFENNQAEMSMGGAIFVVIPPDADYSNPQNYQGPYITGTVFQSNLASTGGAICIDSPSSNLGGLLITQSRFTGNAALGAGAPTLPGYGGAIMSFNTTFIFYQTDFHDNAAVLGGGALWAGGQTPSFPHLINCTFAGNTLPDDNPGTAAMFTDSASASFFNTHLNGPFTSENQVDLLVERQATVSISADGNSDTPCVFNGFSAVDSAILVFNCTPTLETIYLADSALVVLNKASRFVINANINWIGGGFSCDLGGLISYTNPTNLIGKNAFLANNNPKTLAGCNLNINGPLRVTHIAGSTAIDLSLTGGAEIHNYGTISTGGDVVFHTTGSTFLENSGHLLIEKSFSLIGQDNATFGYSSVGSNTLVFIILFDQNGTITPTADAAASSAITPYTALNVGGVFTPNGILQVNFPDLYKGLHWDSLVTYASRTSKFSIHRGSFPNSNNITVGFPLNPKYEEHSLNIKISNTVNFLTGNDVFGIIFGVLVTVSILCAIGYIVYRKKSGSVEYHGEVYETIDKPVYGTA